MLSVNKRPQETSLLIQMDFRKTRLFKESLRNGIENSRILSFQYDQFFFICIPLKQR